MTKRIHAKHKIDRRLGENIWGRPKSPFNKREYGPGEHGQRRRGKLSDYGQQLRAKQKLKGYYGNITEKQFKAIYREAARLRGDTSEKLIGLLERRLDAIVYRAKFVPTVFAARQFVSHGHVKVNGRRVNIPSYRCREGDVVEVRDRAKDAGMVLEASQSPERQVPDYIDVDHNKMTAKLTRIPTLSGSSSGTRWGISPQVMLPSGVRSASPSPTSSRGSAVRSTAPRSTPPTTTRMSSAPKAHQGCGSWLRGSTCTAKSTSMRSPNEPTPTRASS